MSTTKKTVICVLALSLTLTGSLAASRDHARRGDAVAVASARDTGAHHDPLLDLARLARFLDLGEDQLEAARDLIAAHREAVQPIREEMRDLGRQLREALEVDAPSPAVVGQIVIDLHAARDELEALRQYLDTEFSALLTSEQLEKYQCLKEVLRHFRWPRRGSSDG